MHAGLLVLMAMLVIALTNLGLAAWLAALIVAVISLGAGYALLNRGLSALRGVKMAPRQTIETLKEDARWTTRQGA
jgi:drug/metabolite transporter (DMT)-like permease